MKDSLNILIDASSCEISRLEDEDSRARVLIGSHSESSAWEMLVTELTGGFDSEYMMYLPGFFC